MNVEEEKKDERMTWLLRTCQITDADWVSPVELKSLQMFTESRNVLLTTLKQDLRLQKITHKEGGSSGNHFLFRLFFF